MGADAAHEHDWVLVSAVLDGKGAFRVLACNEPDCDATAVQPASGDLEIPHRGHLE